MFLSELTRVKKGDLVTINPHAQLEPRRVRREKLKRESKSLNIEDRKIRKV